MSEQGHGFARFYWPLIGLAACFLLLFLSLSLRHRRAPCRATPDRPASRAALATPTLPGSRRTAVVSRSTATPTAADNIEQRFSRSTIRQRQPKKPWVPPISMMSIVGFTHTATDMPPPADPLRNNDNISIPPLSFFWGGAITDHIGAFAQVTYSQAPPAAGIGDDPFVHAWSWDNTDVRYADSTTLGKMNITYGITANNNPTVQDPWNTTPAWAFPYAVSPFWAGIRSRPDHRRRICGIRRQCRRLCLYQRSDLPRNVGLSHA